MYLALVHYPVLNRRGEPIVSAVTNLDIHDIARVATVYGLSGYFVVTPLAEQQDLVRTLVGHWRGGVGGELNPDRRKALGLVRIADDLDSVRRRIAEETGDIPRFCATTARRHPGAVSWRSLRAELARGGRENTVLLFGTASGLDPEILEQADLVLAPIEGAGEYRHLSVRSAVAISLDRLIGDW